MVNLHCLALWNMRKMMSRKVLRRLNIHSHFLASLACSSITLSPVRWELSGSIRDITVPALASAAAGLVLPLVLWVNMSEMVDRRKCRLPVKMLAFLSCLAPFFYLLTGFIPQKALLPGLAGGLSASARASSLVAAVAFLGVR